MNVQLISERLVKSVNGNGLLFVIKSSSSEMFDFIAYKVPFLKV